MGYVIRMPQMGMSMDEGTVVAWEVDEGDEVTEGDTLVVVESEKASNEVEAREDGVLRRILVVEEGVVEPGAAIGILAGADEDLSSYEPRIEGDLEAASPADSEDQATPSSETAGEGAGGVGTTAAGGPSTDVRATPGARKLAGDRGVDLEAIEGSGPQGVVTEDDVEAAATSGGAAVEEADVRATPGARQLARAEGVTLAAVEGTGPQGVITDDDVEAHLEAATPEASSEGAGATRTVVETRELTGMQRTISERLGESYRNAVHVTLNRSFDTSVLREVAQTASDAGASGSITDLLIKACGVALETHPSFNALFDDNEHRLIKEINVGVAVDIEAGLVTPVVPNVAEKSTEGVNESRTELTDRVQSGGYTMDDLSGGTFTISNLGLFGIDDFDPVINPPQIAILGIGRIRDDGSMTLSLSFDHRVVNGADAARFLDTLVETLTDEPVLTSFFETEIDGQGGVLAEREIRVRSSSGFAGSYHTAHGSVAFDEPEDVGGTGTAPSPVDHLLGALGACLSLSIRALAQRDEIEVGAITSTVKGSPERGSLEEVVVDLELETEAEDGAVDRLVTKAERACYVAGSLADDLPVSVEWSKA